MRTNSTSLVAIALIVASIGSCELAQARDLGSFSGNPRGGYAGIGHTVQPTGPRAHAIESEDHYRCGRTVRVVYTGVGEYHIETEDCNK